MFVQSDNIENSLLNIFLHFNMIFKPGKRGDSCDFNFDSMIVSLIKWVSHNNWGSAYFNWSKNAWTWNLSNFIVKNLPLVVAWAAKRRKLPKLTEIILISRASE